jgi:hypothetical protein
MKRPAWQRTVILTIATIVGVLAAAYWFFWMMPFGAVLIDPGTRHVPHP